MIKKRHHFVPKTYLKSFCNDDGKIFVINKDGPNKILHQKPDNTAFQKYYYSTYTKEGEKDHNVLEDYFGTVETKWSGILSKIENKDNLAGCFADFYNFIALQRVRVPAARDQIELMKAHLAQMTARQLDKQRVFSPPPTSIAHLDIFKDISVSIDPHQSLMHLGGMLKTMGTILDSLGLSVLHNITDVPFITSDNPVAYLDPTVPFDELRPYTIDRSLKDVVLFFPLTPKMMLFGSSLKPQRQEFQKNGLLHGELDSIKVVEDFNRHVCKFAYRNIFSIDDREKELVSNYSQIAPTIEFTTMPHEDGEICIARQVFSKRKKKIKWKKDSYI